MHQESAKKFFSFWDNWIWIGIVKLSLLTTGYLSSAANLLTRRPNIRHINKRDFLQLNCLAMIKKYDKFALMHISIVFGLVTMFLVQGSSESGLLHIYLTTISKSVISEIENLCGSSFFKKCSISKPDFKNAEKNLGKYFSFWDYCIWIGLVKLSLLTTEYLSSAANVLTSSSKVCHINKKDFLQLICLHSDQ